MTTNEKQNKQPEAGKKELTPRQIQMRKKMVCLGKAAVTVEAPYNRCQPVAEARTENNAKSKQIVYERSGTQFLRAVMPNHQRIGKTKHNDSQLPHHNG